MRPSQAIASQRDTILRLATEHGASRVRVFEIMGEAVKLVSKGLTESEPAVP